MFNLELEIKIKSISETSEGVTIQIKRKLLDNSIEVGQILLTKNEAELLKTTLIHLVTNLNNHANYKLIELIHH